MEYPLGLLTRDIIQDFALAVTSTVTTFRKSVLAPYLCDSGFLDDA